VGYGVAYAFAEGKATQLGIPSQLISISLSDVLRALAAIVVPLAATYALFSVIIDMISASVLSRLRPIGVQIIIFILAIVFLRAGQARWIWWAIFLGGDVIVLVALPILIAMLASNDKGLRSRFTTAISRESSSSVRSPSLLSTLMSRVGLQTYVVLMIITLILFLSWVAGMGSASNQRVFFEERGTSNVLVAVDGNSFVLEGVDGNQLTGRFSIVSISGNSQLVLNPMVIGPLNTPKVCEYRSC
jgi:hypothetical protein